MEGRDLKAGVFGFFGDWERMIGDIIEEGCWYEVEDSIDDGENGRKVRCVGGRNGDRCMYLEEINVGYEVN